MNWDLDPASDLDPNDVWDDPSDAPQDHEDDLEGPGDVWPDDLDDDEL